MVYSVETIEVGGSTLYTIKWTGLQPTDAGWSPPPKRSNSDSFNPTSSSFGATKRPRALSIRAAASPLPTSSPTTTT